jgi:PAS domain S-box-containing protein
MEPEPGRLTRQIEELHQRLDGLRGRVGQVEPGDLLDMAIGELSVTVEELRVADEELRQQADELLQSQARIEAERQRYRDLFEFSPDGYIVTDVHGRIREINTAAANLLGAPAEMLTNKPLATRVAASSLHDFRARLASALKEPGTQRWEMDIVPRGRSPLPVACSVTQVRGHEPPHDIDLIWRLHDISERRQAQAELERSRERLRALAARLEAVREQERAHVAREVHDELGSSLTAIKMEVVQLRQGLEKLEADDAAGLAARANAAAELIDATMGAVRTIAMELRPAILDDFGLVAALDWQLNEFSRRTGIRGHMHVAPGQTPVAPNQAIAVFRVFQELLTNIARHAGASRVEVRLAQEDGNLQLVVRDDGRGFEPAAATGSGGLGLVRMRERLKALGGELDIASAAGRGTAVEVRLPLASNP